MNLICLLILLLSYLPATAQNKPHFILTDLKNFWKAYDKIKSTTDSTLQYNYLQQEYLNNATVGLKDLIELRRYTAKEYVDAINNYPRFWATFRKAGSQLNNIVPEIEADIRKLKAFYPPLSPATIYFSVGAFRSNGTTRGKNILIAAEMAMADGNTVIDELPTRLQQYYKAYQPLKGLALLCTHEYVHTQQKPLVENLLSSCLYEGIAEFISCKATGKPSNVPAIAFGKANRDKVFKQFVSDLFAMSNDDNWLWGENRNQLGMRDLGYYIGYEISERYYNQSKDKAKAVRELVQLDYNDEKEVERIVDGVGLLPAPLAHLFEQYEKQRPQLLTAQPFEKGGPVKSGLCQITLKFSEPMDTSFRGFDYGPLGEGYIYKFVRVIGWSEDKKTFNYEVELQPGKRYQFLVTNAFRNERGIRLKPRLVEFEASR